MGGPSKYSRGLVEEVLSYFRVNDHFFHNYARQPGGQLSSLMESLAQTLQLSTSEF